MSEDMLRQEQWDAYWAALVAKRDSCRTCTLFHQQELELRRLANEQDAAKRRKRVTRQERLHKARPYVPLLVWFPEGTPTPEMMREAAKPAVTNVLSWSEHAPAHGCHEMRKRIGSRRTTSVGVWGRGTAPQWRSDHKTSHASGHLSASLKRS